MRLGPVPAWAGLAVRMTHLSSVVPARPQAPARSVARAPFARAALFAAVAAALVSCGSGASAGRSDDAGRTPEPSLSRTHSAAAPTSPGPALSGPADGTRTERCRDGRCEVRVREGATVPVPERSGVGRLTVTGIGDRTVTMTAPLVQSQFSSDGGCEMGVTGPSVDSPGFMNLTCEEGSRGGVNKLRVQVLGVAGGAAVLRIGLSA